MLRVCQGVPPEKGDVLLWHVPGPGVQHRIPTEEEEIVEKLMSDLVGVTECSAPRHEQSQDVGQHVRFSGTWSEDGVLDEGPGRPKHPLLERLYSE